MAKIRLCVGDGCRGPGGRSYPRCIWETISQSRGYIARRDGDGCLANVLGKVSGIECVTVGTSFRVYADVEFFAGLPIGFYVSPVGSGIVGPHGGVRGYRFSHWTLTGHPPFFSSDPISACCFVNARS